jgi:hypothetical protein
MATGVNFSGTNRFYGPPEGMENEVVGIPAMKTDRCIVTAWQLTPEELAEVAKTGIVFLSFMSENLVPHYVGSVVSMSEFLEYEK